MRHYGYPYVGRSRTGIVVLFVRPETGVVLYPVNSIGDLNDQWEEHKFMALSLEMAEYYTTLAMDLGYSDKEEMNNGATA